MRHLTPIESNHHQSKEGQLQMRAFICSWDPDTRWIWSDTSLSRQAINKIVLCRGHSITRLSKTRLSCVRDKVYICAMMKKSGMAINIEARLWTSWCGRLNTSGFWPTYKRVWIFWFLTVLITQTFLKQILWLKDSVGVSFRLSLILCVCILCVYKYTLNICTLSRLDEPVRPIL